MNDFLCIVSVMGRCQCGDTSCLVPPGGDSREQGDHIRLRFIQEEERKEGHEQKDPLHPHNIHQESREEIV